MESKDGTGFREKILGTLEQADKQCTNLILEAVRAKDQAGIQLAGQATIKIREIIDELRQPVLEASGRGPASTQQPTKPKKKQLSQRKEYPRFHIENDHLVKTGWSKKARKEYLHKIPRGIYEQLLDIIAEYAKKTNQPFPADGIVAAASELPESIPGYQVYLALGFLRDRDVLQKDGRKGFSVLREIHEAGKEAWRDAAQVR